MTNCDVVQDLLPLYYDNVASEGSRKIVDEHIKICQDCSAVLEKLKDGNDRSYMNADTTEVGAFKVMKRKIRRKNLLIAGVSIIVTAVIVVLIFTVNYYANYSRNAAEEYDNRINLFFGAYGIMMNYLSDEKLLPQFETAELVEESVYGYLNIDDLLALSDKLNNVYPYPISISRGHDRLDSQIPYEDRDFVYVYFSANYRDRTGTDLRFNTVRVEGFVDNNTYPVIMYFRYNNNAWDLVKAELFEYDGYSSTYKMISSR